MIDTKVYQLDLPTPSQKLINTAISYITNTDLPLSAKQWLDVYHTNINSALHLFSTDKEVTKLIIEEYSDFFPATNLTSLIGIMKNISLDTPACQPPHTDRYRSLAINYYIDLGGDDVQTSFYDHNEPTHLTKATNFRYADVDKIGHCIFDKDRWYAYNVSQCHSVENIISTRCFLSIGLVDKPSYKIDDLLRDTNIKGQPVKLWTN